MLSKTTIAIFCIAAIAIAGLIKGIDGALLVSSCSAISALAGVAVGKQMKS